MKSANELIADGVAAAKYAVPLLGDFADAIAGHGDDTREAVIANAIDALNEFIRKAA